MPRISRAQAEANHQAIDAAETPAAARDAIAEGYLKIDPLRWS
jgi:hypothetical protein